MKPNGNSVQRSNKELKFKLTWREEKNKEVFVTNRTYCSLTTAAD